MELNIKVTNISREVISSNYYCYPNLGRPNDHFSVTPFESVFVSYDVQPHIRLKDASSQYVSALNNYILNEVEPWYLGLQNMRLGAQAHSNYRYYSYRRAKHRIEVGYSVTPTTDLGDYIVEANGKLTLKAGDEIWIKTGVHFKSGSIVHIIPEYNRCSGFFNKSMIDGGNSDDDEQDSQQKMMSTLALQKQEFNLYPNPVSEVLTIESVSQTNIDEVSIYNLNGVLCLYKLSNRSKLTMATDSLEKGIYI